MEGRILISNLHDVDQQLKQKAVAYFKACKEAEEAMDKYENAKYSVDMNLSHKKNYHDAMINSLKKAREQEVLYKEVVDNSNSFIADFRVNMDKLCQALLDIEKDRCEAVHSTINKFVVYEKFSEMNNKYDVNNFSKLIDEYNNEDEVNTIKE